ncbi:uncharacterized protein LY89DRAFT_145329 [Mollisia scopiformis]|uniref:CCHC-type domain-containing protein n=1 Tax=Mollisia scopiformis TaxID=149040 RepID=A0A194X0F1_MOLSC|nr:uncharacterized protein LY89DRAFT_145329 [Mollisia scopiformis]KUJ13676.1 hypothetical protein LY89DRAFT_145329 [Mollisia scopiformis]
MQNEIKQSAEICDEIATFQLQRIMSAKGLREEISHAHIAIEDIEEGQKQATAVNEAQIIREGGMLPAKSHAEHWEAETHADDNVPNNVDLDCAVEELRNQIDGLRARFNFECTLHGMMQKLKLEFAINANLDGAELDKFVSSTDDDQEMRLGRSSLPNAMPMMNDFVKGALNPKLKDLGMAILSTHLKEDKPYTLEYLARCGSPKAWNSEELNDIFNTPETESAPPTPVNEDWAEPPIPCFTCGQTGHAAKDCRVVDFPAETEAQYLEAPESKANNEMPSTKLWVEKDVYCDNCGMYGHSEDYCNHIFPEEEKPNYCNQCKKHGHMEDTCWRLHPWLKEQFLKEQFLKEQFLKEKEEKEKKTRCLDCGRVGHERRFCYKVHQYK